MSTIEILNFFTLRKCAVMSNMTDMQVGIQVREKYYVDKIDIPANSIFLVIPVRHDGLQKRNELIMLTQTGHVTRSYWGSMCKGIVVNWVEYFD